MAERKNKRKETLEALIKQQVFEAAERICEAHSPGDLTIEVIARETGIAMGTLYRYFRNRADMIAYIVLKSLEPVENETEQIANSDMSTKEKLRAYIKCNLRVNDTKKELLNLLYKTSSAAAMAPIKEVEEARKRSGKRLMGIMEEGISRGVLREVPVTNLMLTFAGIFQAFSGYRLINLRSKKT